MMAGVCLCTVVGSIVVVIAGSSSSSSNKLEVYVQVKVKVRFTVRYGTQARKKRNARFSSFPSFVPCRLRALPCRSVCICARFCVSPEVSSDRSFVSFASSHLVSFRIRQSGPLHVIHPLTLLFLPQHLFSPRYLFPIDPFLFESKSRSS